MDQAKMKIVCIGDSLTWGFPYGPMYSWVHMLEKVLDMEIINQGINGNTTGDMRYRFERSVLNYHPTHVVIMGGSNDVICQVSYDRIILNLKTMTENALAEGIKVILGTPPAIDYPEEERRMARVRAWVTEYAREKSLPVIDFGAAFFDEQGRIRSEFLLADGAHPTQKGYEAMFKQIDPRIFV